MSAATNIGAEPRTQVYEFYVLYKLPAGHTMTHAVHRWLATEERVQPDSLPCLTAPSVNMARTALRLLKPGLVNIGRRPGDAGPIVEIWI